MICVHCAGENAGGSRFCHACGQPLGRTCPGCRFENPPESTFCGGCGGRLAEVRSEDADGERRQLTVLFCDIVGSTDLAERLDPEDLAAMLAEHQRICGEAVRAHGGYVSQYLGDGVVVYFGYPRSYEDEPQRAVRCGLEILARTRALRDSGHFPADTGLDVRLGAHSGRALVGPVGAGDRRDRLALGSTPNVAARLQAEAEPGTLVVSADTWRIVRNYFDGQPLGARRLKGMAEPIDLWLVTGEGESSERVEVAGVLTRFVGRTAERAVLEQTWKQTSTTDTSLFVLLRGEPGVGKSRLAQLFRDEAQSVGAEVITMRATAYSTGSPFHPVIEFLERRFALDVAVSDDDRRAYLTKGLRWLGLTDEADVGLLASLLSLPAAEGDPSLALTPARRRYRTLEVLVELLVAIASASPTLLLVEDLHWADESTLDLLAQLADNAPPVPLMGLFTARPEARSPGTDDAVRVVELPRLDRADVELMVREVAQGKSLPRTLLGRIVTRSDGIPLFVEELTLSALESGRLRELDLSWEAVDVADESMIPASVDASLMSRIDRLGASRATAQLAATIGREFSLALLTEVSERNEATLAEDLARLVASGLVRPVGPDQGSFEFRHALIRDAAYNSLLRSTRQVHHRHIGEALRRSDSHGGSARPDLIARHLTAAGENAAAVPFWEAAGHQALARTAVRAAAGHFTAAVQCLHKLPADDTTAERELDLQILLAPLLMAVHGFGAPQGEQACRRALALAQDLGRFDRLYPPMWGLWTVHWLRGELQPATEAAHGVLQLAQAAGVPMLEVTARHALSYTLFSRGEYNRCAEEAEAGLALFDLDQERALVGLFGLSSTVALRSSRAFALWMRGETGESERELARMSALARELGHPPSLAIALGCRLWAAAMQGSYAGDTEVLADPADELVELSRDDDFFMWHALGCTFRAIVAHGRGLAGSGQQMLDGLDLWQQAGARLTLVMMNVFCAEAFYRSGDDEESHRRLDAAAEEAARGEGPMEPEIFRVRGRLLARAGDTAAAEAAYRTALRRARAQEAAPLELRATLDLADLLAVDARATEAVDALAEAFIRCPDRGGHESIRAAARLTALGAGDLIKGQT